MATLTLKLLARDITGRKVKQLRRQGIIPVHMYGQGTDPLSLQVPDTVLRTLMVAAGRNIPIEVEIEGGGWGSHMLYPRDPAPPGLRGSPTR